MKATIAIFLTVELDPSRCLGGLDVVDDALDAGFLQDCINEELNDGERVTCCVARAVPQALLEQYDAADPGSSDGCEAL